MALKDWKKEWERDGAKRYYWKKYPSITLQVGTYKKVSDKPTPKWSGKSYVDIDDPGVPKKVKSEVKLFRTKSTALRYTRAYMRRH